MPCVVAVVGQSKSGKTTFIVKLIGELASRGYKVAAVKHSECGFDIDRPGKDTWLMSEAGAVAVAMASSGELAVIKKHAGDPELKEVLEVLGGDFDIVLVEGYKKAPVPKVEIHRGELSDELVSTVREGLIAVVTDSDLEMPVPKFSPGDASEVADLIEEKFLKGARDGQFVRRL